MSIYKS